MKKTLFPTLLAATICAGSAAMLEGCGGGVSDGGSLPTLNLEAAIDNPKPFNLADIAESIEYIPLDDSDPRGLVGSIGGMAESRTGFYLCEGFMTPVQHFDRAGRFVSTIGRIGRGPDELSYIAGMAVDYDSGDVYVDGLQAIAAYDSSGRMFARNNSIPSTSTGAVVWCDGELLLLVNLSLRNPDAYGGERIDFIRKFSRDLKPAGAVDAPNLGPGDYWFSDGRSEAAGTGSPAFMSDSGENLIVRQGRNDTLYHYSAGVLTPVLLLDLGRYALPAEGYGLNPAVEMGDRFYAADNIWEGSRYIVVSADNYQRRPTGERIPGRRLVFDRHDLTAGGFSATGSDGVPGIFIDGVAFHAMYVRDGRLVGYVNAIDIVDNAGSITDPKLRALAATLREDSNPVIVVAELKK